MERGGWISHGICLLPLFIHAKDYLLGKMKSHMMFYHVTLRRNTHLLDERKGIKGREEEFGQGKGAYMPTSKKIAPSQCNPSREFQEVVLRKVKRGRKSLPLVLHALVFNHQ